jgi:hypothetical protein
MSLKAANQRRRNGLAAFRALEGEISAAIVAGRTLLDIYAEKQDRLRISYSQFARYAHPIRTAARSAARAAQVVEQLARAQRATPPARTTPTPKAASTSSGPPKGRPEDAIPTLKVDLFAVGNLKRNEDLF